MPNENYYGVENDVLQQRIQVRSSIRQKHVKAKFNVLSKSRIVTKSVFRKIDLVHRKEISTTNTVEIPKILLKQVAELIDDRSKGISDILIKEGLACILAYRHALVYTGVVMRDGLKIEPAMVDNDVDEILANALKIRVLEYLLNKIKISPKYRDLLIGRVVSKLLNKPYKYREMESPIEGVTSIITSQDLPDKVKP